MARKTIQPSRPNDPRPRCSQGILTEGGKVLFYRGQTALPRIRIWQRGNEARDIRRVVFENIKLFLKRQRCDVRGDGRNQHITDKKIIPKVYSEVRRDI